MAIVNQWGKSAVDATRKNALPPYLDSVFSEGLGSGVTIVTVTLDSSNWAMVNLSSNTKAAFRKWYDFGLDSKGKPILVDDGSVIKQLYTDNAAAIHYGVKVVSAAGTSVLFQTGSVSTSINAAMSPSTDIKIVLEVIN